MIIDKYFTKEKYYHKGAKQFKNTILLNGNKIQLIKHNITM